MDEELIFDIRALMPDGIKSRLEEQATLGDKAAFLCDLLSFSSSDKFTNEEKQDITEYYLAATGARYEPPVLDDDTKKIIVSYTLIIKNLEKSISFINKCCNDRLRDDAIEKAKCEINEIESKNNEKVVDFLVFDDDKKTKTERKRNLSSILYDAQKRINETKK